MNNKDKERLINKALTETYKVLALIDLNKGTFERIYFNGGQLTAYTALKQAEEMLDTAITYYVDDPYLASVRAFLDISNLSERLKGKEIVSIEFESARIGWCRASFVPAETDDNGEIISVLYKVQKLDSELLAVRKRLSIEETLLQCVRLLTNNNNFDDSINKLLAIIARYHSAERAYIFEVDKENNVLHNTYEYCRDGVSPQIDFLKDVDIHVIDRWFEYFERHECVSIDILSRDVDSRSDEYRILAVQGIERLLVAPFILDGRIVGFMGVDNPSDNFGNQVLLKSVSEFVAEELQKKKYVELLYSLSYRDKMTGLYNRHAYIDDIEKLNRQSRRNVGVVYADANGLKITNDTYGHKFGDKLLINVADSLKKSFCRTDDKIYRIGGDEFVVICTDIDEREFLQKVGEYIRILGDDPIASVGEVWLSECTDLEKQIITADQLMYRRKSSYHKINALKRQRVEQETVRVSETVDACGMTPEPLLGLSFLVVDTRQENVRRLESAIKSLGGDVCVADTLDKAYEIVKNAQDNFDEFSAVIISESVRDINVSAISQIIKRQIGMDGARLILMVENLDSLKLIPDYMEADDYIYGDPCRQNLAELLSFSEPEEVPDIRKSGNLRPDMSGKRALLVEDNEMNREVAGGLLELTGIEIHEAFDGKQALKEIEKHPQGYYDIIFMDIQMPVMDGYETCRRLRQMGINTPIVAMTANAFYEDVQASKKAGMNEHLAKPLNVDEIFEVLRKYLR